MKKTVAFVVLMLTVPTLIAGSATGFVAAEIFLGDSSHLERNKIVEILSKESVVLYSDGQTQLGSLFGQEHRHYVLFHEMPKNLVNAVVAAEDDRFFSHFGVDPVSTIRAGLRNILLGKHEGASTITQQTVKNLYGRTKVNLMVKLREAINALKMERKYKKEEILEFYLNQFHVSGNGRGVGIASKYYFDKDVSDLTLVEAAFIAGSVKAPDRYAPFGKRTAQAQEKARAAAKIRKDYVVKRMYELKMIDAPSYEKAKSEQVPFRQGRFQFNDIAAIDLVQRQLNRKEILGAVGVESVDELGTLGLRITTTVDKNVQVAAQYGVRQNLSRLEMILTGFQKEPEANFSNIQKPEQYGFYVARVTDVNSKAGAEQIRLNFGVPECLVPTVGINRVATYLDRAIGLGTVKQKARFLATLKPGEFVLASVRSVDETTGQSTCDIERRPRIQGALIALDRGKIAAMVGGFQPHEYNRAVFARRQPGSTFKTLTYYPALQMGWSPLDKLLNVRTVHSWQDQFYFPRPDHLPESLETTLIGAGAKSENLASVWLLHHLTDRLSFDQFLDLLHTLGYYNEGDTGDVVLSRLQRKFNVRMTEDHFRTGAFVVAQNELMDDFTVLAKPSLRSVVRMMNYGTGFESDTALAATNVDDRSHAEHEIRVQVLRNSFVRWQRVLASAKDGFEKIKNVVEQGAALPPELRVLASRFRIARDGSSLAYFSDDSFQLETVSPLTPPEDYRTLSTDELLVQLDANRKLLDFDALLLDGSLPVGLFKSIEQATNEKFEQVKTLSVLEKLYYHDDFKFSLGMFYANKMCKEMGIDSEIQWVPSYPLGANVVTLSELAAAYQTILTGKTWRYFDDGSENQVLVIDRIEDLNGQLIWEAEGKSHQLIENFYSAPMLAILRSTVTHGTAYAANGAIVLSAKSGEAKNILEKAAIRVPSFGKTGTTNEYVNATYVGFLPYPELDGQDHLTAENAYTIAAYVGYDTNEPMKRGGFKVAGGTGALPAWIEAAKAFIREKDYASKLRWKNLVEKKVTEVPFDFGFGGTGVRVGLHSSVIAENNDSADTDDAGEDANNYNDYSVSRKSLLSVPLPGSVERGIFVPKRKVQFYDTRLKNDSDKPGAVPTKGPAH